MSMVIVPASPTNSPVPERHGEVVRMIQQGAGPAQAQRCSDLIKPAVHSVSIYGLPAVGLRVDIGPPIQKDLDSVRSAPPGHNVERGLGQQPLSPVRISATIQHLA